MVVDVIRNITKKTTMSSILLNNLYTTKRIIGYYQYFEYILSNADISSLCDIVASAALLEASMAHVHRTESVSDELSWPRLQKYKQLIDCVRRLSHVKCSD